MKDNDQKFIVRLLGKFISDKKLCEKWQYQGDMYIVACICDLVENKSISWATAKRIYPKITPTLNQVLETFEI